jgi:hypothetical protein
MMNETINALTELLNRRITSTSLVTIVARGEELRRRIARLSANGRTDALASALLARYDAILPYCRALFVSPEGMVNYVGVAGRALTDYAGMRPSSRSREDGEQILVEIEEALAYSQAGVRAGVYQGKITEYVVRSLNDALRKFAPHLPDLWEFAGARARELDCDGAYAFTAHLAKLSPNRLAMVTF